MKTLKQIVIEMEDDLSIANDILDGYYFSEGVHNRAIGRRIVIQKYLPHLKLLLNEQPEAITQVVGQNEQTKKHLTQCNCVWPQCNHLQNCRNR